MIAVIVLYDTRSCRQQESSSNGEACVACAVDGQNQCIKILQPFRKTSQLKGKIQSKFLVRDFSDINLQGHGSPGHGSQWACPSGNKSTAPWVSQRHESLRASFQGGPQIALFKKGFKKVANRANPVHGTHQETQRGNKESHDTHYCKRKNRTCFYLRSGQCIA